MKKSAIKSEMVLTLSLVGILGVLLTIISDFILIGKPISGYAFLKLGTESMADISQWRITLGAFFGIIVLPFQLLGLIPVYHGLKPSGKIMPIIMVITSAHALIMGVAFHISYAYIGSQWKAYHEAGLEIRSDIVNKFDLYWKLIILIVLIELLFSSTIYVISIMSGKTLYPKWMAILNPLCILIIVFPIIFILPAPIGGFFASAYVNISTMVFFSFTTAIIYKKV